MRELRIPKQRGTRIHSVKHGAGIQVMGIIAGCSITAMRLAISNWACHRCVYFTPSWRRTARLHCSNDHGDSDRERITTEVDVLGDGDA